MQCNFKNFLSGITIAGAIAANNPFPASASGYLTQDNPARDHQILNESISPYHRERDRFPALVDVIESNLTFTQQQGSFINIRAVAEFQLLLSQRFGADLGFSGVDGKFGPNTAREVSRFQESRNIPVSSPVQIDAVTARAMLESWPPAQEVRPANATLIDVLSGAIEIPRMQQSPLPALPIVREVQRLLISNGFDVGATYSDGKFGPRTEQALMAYQRSRMLEVKSPVTIDAATVSALLNNLPEVDIKAPEDILYLKSQKWFQNISKESADCLLDFIKSGGRERREPVMSVMRMDELRLFSSAEQEKIITLCLTVLPDGNRSVASLLRRCLPDGRRAVLDRGSCGSTVLDSLANVATAPLHPSFETMRSHILSALAQKLADPSATTQGAHGTCVPASIQYYLLEHRPGKAARLVVGLLMTEGTVELPGGDTLVRVADSIYPDSSPHRSIPQRVFQAALMELGNGEEFSYSNSNDYHFVPDTDRRRRTGLTFNETVDLIENLSGERPVSFSDPEVSAEQLRKVVEAGVPKDSIIILRWRELLPGEMLDIHGYHAVNFISFDREQNFIYYRNPWGRLQSTNGANLDNPPRQVVDSEKGIERMSADEFFKRLRVVTIMDYLSP